MYLRRVDYLSVKCFVAFAMSALPKRFFTPEEYLAFEVAADYRSQYVDGEIFAMAGAQPWHIEVVDNLTIALGTRLRGKAVQIIRQRDARALDVGQPVDLSRRGGAVRPTTV